MDNFDLSIFLQQAIQSYLIILSRANERV